MLMVGARARPMPLVASSEPMTLPYWRARPGSKAAASAMGAGSWVVPGNSLAAVFMNATGHAGGAVLLGDLGDAQLGDGRGVALVGDGGVDLEEMQERCFLQRAHGPDELVDPGGDGDGRVEPRAGLGADRAALGVGRVGPEAVGGPADDRVGEQGQQTCQG